MTTTHGVDFGRRSAGVLLHLTSLPGPYASGDLSQHASRFADWCAAAGVTWWQMLPIGPTGPATSCSPYSATSSHAGNPSLIDLDALVRNGLLTRRDLRGTPRTGTGRADLVASMSWREAALRRAFAAVSTAHDTPPPAVATYAQEQAHWLDDYALYAALSAEQAKPWWEWDAPLRRRSERALGEARERLAGEMAYHRFTQYLFDRQWHALREYANARGVFLVGDIPIFVGHDSADAWANQRLFQLDRRGRPRRVTGAPPDAFSATGQRWGHPQYDWNAHEREGLAWWVERFRSIFRRFDAVRIDHFLGFSRVWSIPASSPTATSGRWVASPGRGLFAAVRAALGDRPIFAEDLGALTPEAAALRDELGFPGMRVIQFGFGEDDGHYHRPHRYPPHSVAYTGTHDNDTTAGWLLQLPPARRREALAYAGGSTKDATWSLVRSVLTSPANTAIIPMQDLLGLGGKARMNTPGTTEGNWSWRLTTTPDAALRRRLRKLIELTERDAARR